ncbi:UDP-N-acetylmuramoyl-L-alanyl-D-glutamate--2,6-diaminopimelate ligase [Bdellovibrionota bacterium]
MMKIEQLFSDIKDVSPTPAGIPIKGIHYDSRKIGKGDLFIAVKGLTTDGHEFLPEAEKQGAAAAIVEKTNPTLSMPQFVVPDCREALAAISAKWFKYPSRELTLVGITGTNGKTTTAYILESMAKQAGYKTGVIGTINYRYGNKIIVPTHTTPESYDLHKLLREMVDAGVNYAIMEVSSHGLELKRVWGCEFDAAVFTNLTQDHLDFHTDLEQYFESKALLFENVITKSSKPKTSAILNVDDPRGENLTKRTKVSLLTYGITNPQKVDLSTKNLRFTFEGLEGDFSGKISEPFKSSMVGMHNVYNILAASGSALATKIDKKFILKGIESLAGVPGRLQRISRGNPNDPLVLVDYAHTEDALRNVLSTLQSLPKKGRILTLVGCGGDRDPQKRPLMGQAAMSSSDIVIITSDNPRTEDPLKIIDDILPGLARVSARQLTLSEVKTEQGYIVEPDRRKAIRLIIDVAKVGDIVLIAGKGHENYQIIGRKKIHFDDSEIALDALKEK